jgi:hypothetical protein
MGMMETIQCGKQPMPPRVMVYGTEGVGKSTFAAAAPKPIFIQTEDGLGEIECDKFPLAQSVDDVQVALNELRTAKHPYGTVVIDSLDWLERLIWERVCDDFFGKDRTDNKNAYQCIEKVDGGYQRGYVHALVHWRRLVDSLTALRNERGLATILIAHARAEKFEAPDLLRFDRFGPKLHKHALSLLSEWVDAILFAHWKCGVEQDSGGTPQKLQKQVKRGEERVLITSGGTGWVAKNRFNLPSVLPLSWPALFAGLTQETPNKKGS